MQVISTSGATETGRMVGVGCGTAVLAGVGVGRSGILVALTVGVATETLVGTGVGSAVVGAALGIVGRGVGVTLAVGTTVGVGAVFPTVTTGGNGAVVGRAAATIVGEFSIESSIGAIADDSASPDEPHATASSSRKPTTGPDTSLRRIWRDADVEAVDIPKVRALSKN